MPVTGCFLLWNQFIFILGKKVKNYITFIEIVFPMKSINIERSKSEFTLSHMKLGTLQHCCSSKNMFKQQYTSKFRAEIKLRTIIRATV